jgi:thioredoxin-like negative regulator of GroEL
MQLLEEIIPNYKDRITFYKVDIDKEIDLANIFQVRGIPHFVTISKDGGVSPGSGALNKETLKYFLEGLLLK